MKDSLNVVDGRGQAVPIPNNVRLYLLSSLQHGGNNPPRELPGRRTAMCENPTNPVYHGPTLRALLVALDALGRQGRQAARQQLSDAAGRHARLGG